MDLDGLVLQEYSIGEMPSSLLRARVSGLEGPGGFKGSRSLDLEEPNDDHNLCANS